MTALRTYGVGLAMLWTVVLYGATSSGCTAEPAASSDSAAQAVEATDLELVPLPGETCGLCPLVHQKLAAGIAVAPECAISCIDCGDGICNNGETNQDCPHDCPLNPPTHVCGNGRCETGETRTSCPADCGGTTPVCGNGRCEAGENTDNCREDCCRLQNPPCTV